MLEGYLSDSSLPLSERICSHAVSSGDLSRGSDRSDRRSGRALRRRSRERSRRRSVPCAPSCRAQADICRVRGTRSAFPPAPVKSPCPVPGRLPSPPAEGHGRAGPGCAHGLGLEPSRAAGPEPTRGAEPSRGQAAGFLSSLTLMEPGTEAGGEPPVPLGEAACRLSFSFCSSLSLP